MVGKTISHYRVLEKLGEGGMGVVYKAKDTHLDRLVAIKLLPAERVADAERKRRFIQEAKAASALNHPNIVTIYAIESEPCTAGVPPAGPSHTTPAHAGPAGGTPAVQPEPRYDFIVMEYVAGKTLHELIGRKGLKLAETLKCAVQVADALAAAHAAGIVHRDLKPANIMVTEKGLVKVLDFGLAKLTEADSSNEGETLTGKDAPRTEEGTILGTVAYMSPEQAEGKKIDARSDIFSFGSVLYEMITGRRAFQGETRLSTQSAILKEDPQPISTIVEDSPRELERIVARCLRKDPARRFQLMEDVKITLEELKEESASGKLAPAQLGAKPQPRGWWFWAGRVALGLALIAAGIWLRVSQPGVSGGPAPRVVPLTSYPGREIQPALSPDGKQVAFAWNGEKEDNFDVYVKLVDAGTPLRLTTDPRPDYAPAWSPDGRYIAFLRLVDDQRSAEVLVVPSLGGPEQNLGQVGAMSRVVLWKSTGYGLSWSPDGEALAVVEASPQGANGIFLLSMETREKRRLTSPPAGMEDLFPAFSPDGRTLAFVRLRVWGDTDVFLLPMRAGESSGEPVRLTHGAGFVSGLDWTPNGDSVLFSSNREGGRRLWRVPAVGGQPQPLAAGGEGASELSASRQGRRLAYSRIAEDYNIWRIGISGGAGRASPPAKLISSTRLDERARYSPDGKRIVFISDRSGNEEVWACDTEGSNCVQLTHFRGPSVGCPRWSPDGRRIAFDSTREGNADVYIVGADGGAARRLTQEPSHDIRPSWSRDGRWIYFSSDRSGDSQLWKTPAEGGTAVQLTRKGGREAFEGPDGTSLYYTKYATKGIWRLPVDGGEETLALDRGETGDWAVTAQGLWFLEPGPKSVTTVYLYSFATGKLSQIAKLQAQEAGHISISPDGRWIIYTQLDRVESDLMLVENFR